MTYWAIAKNTGHTLHWTNVTDVAYSDEVVYAGRLHSFEFPAVGMTWGGAGYVDDDLVGGFSLPDSVSKTAPRHTAQQRSIITLTVTHDATTKTVRIFRDELVAGCLLTADPDA